MTPECDRLFFCVLHSNPLAGTDTTLLALAGVGYSQGKAMGFASCERVVGASEGMNILQHTANSVQGNSGPRLDFLAPPVQQAQERKLRNDHA